MAAWALLLFTHTALYAHVRSVTQANPATRVAAEMTKGRLSPAESKPGDTLAVRLKDDDLFSHFDNDTVIASAGKSFEISSGAQMQFLVGMHRSGNRLGR